MCICMLLYNCCWPDQQELIYSKRNTCSPLFAFQDTETMVLKKIRILLRSCWEKKKPWGTHRLHVCFQERLCLSDSFAEKTNAREMGCDHAGRGTTSWPDCIVMCPFCLLVKSCLCVRSLKMN